MTKLVLLIGIVFLTACSSTSQFYSAECASPGTPEKFVYEGFTDSRVEGNNTLALTNKEHVVYYAIPAGTACRVVSMENSNNYEQEEH